MSLILKVIKIRIIPHILFWGIAYVVLLYLFSEDVIAKVDYIYTGIFSFTLLLAVYVHRMIGLRYLKTQPFIYVVVGIAVVFAGVWFNQIVFDKLIDYVLKGYYFISYYSYGDIVKFFLSFVIAATLFKLSKEAFILEDIKTKMVRLEKEKAQVELKALTEQVNPHFLFNSLNVLYALAMKNSKESPDAILRLSDILRYVIYDVQAENVKVSNEQKLIDDYIALQNYRIDENATIRFEVNIEKDRVIAPLLFLPLVENSFKHGIKGDVGETFVDIKLSSTSQNVVFQISNNKCTNSNHKKSGGIGLENIKQRLELLYPDKHSFEIEDNEHSFSVKLQINE